MEEKMQLVSSLLQLARGNESKTDITKSSKNKEDAKLQSFLGNIVESTNTYSKYTIKVNKGPQ